MDELKSQQNIKSLSVEIDLYNDFKKSDLDPKLNLFDIISSKLESDIFLSLYKVNPVLMNKGDVEIMFQPNHAILSNFIDSVSYSKAKDITTSNLFNSSVATQILAADVKQELSNYLNNLDIPEEEEDKIINFIDKQEQINSFLEDNDKEEDKLSEEYKNLLEALVEAHNDISDEVKEKMEVELSNLTPNTQISSRLVRELEAIDDVQKAWNLDMNDKFDGTLEDKIRLIKNIARSPYLKKITNLLGNFKVLAIDSQKKHKDKERGVTPVSLKNGDDLQNLTVPEKLNLINPTTKKDFRRRFYEKNLSQYELEGCVKKGNGPIICCIDVSGSMEEKLANSTRLEAAIALTLSILNIAKIQKRNMMVIPYNTHVKCLLNFEKGRLNTQDMEEITRLYANGGTSFKAPLKTILDDVITDKCYKNGDILFITDGEAVLQEEFLNKFLKEKKKSKFSVLSLNINDEKDGVKKLESFSDAIISIGDLSKASMDLESIFKYF